MVNINDYISWSILLNETFHFSFSEWQTETTEQQSKTIYSSRSKQEKKKKKENKATVKITTKLLSYVLSGLLQYFLNSNRHTNTHEVV